MDFIHGGGLSFESYQSFSSDADLLIHDAEYTKEEYEVTKQWGHSVYTTALELAINAKVKQFGLFHLNQERTDQDMDQMVEKCRQIVAEQDSDLECFAVGADMTFML